MKPKKTILILCDWFLPGYLAGGPIQSVATLTEHLAENFHFKIITTDRDFKSKAPYENVKINEWTRFLGREVYYVSPENMKPDFILKLIKSVPHDVIYLNSLFSKLFAIYPLKWKRTGHIKSKIVLAPRGMLRDAALNVKPIKKTLFLIYAKLVGLFKGVHWQSTLREETDEIRRRIGASVQISEVSNLPVTSKEISFLKKDKGHLKLCFIARIVNIKNLNFAIDLLHETNNCTIEFDIFGPKEDEAYWKICETNAKFLPDSVLMNYCGVLQPGKIGATLSRYHALLLPTQTENFGHIIVQSLQTGRPVIISDQTPWKDLKDHNVGFDISLKNKYGFVEAVHTLAQMGQADFDKMCNDSLSYITEKLNIDKIKSQYINMFSE
ncbi:MAG: group 1 glycosyl transferase [Bacteroidota bacterium]|nr:group 1 glycosyl transferase [Bacteroidota bacterium]